MADLRSAYHGFAPPRGRHPFQIALFFLSPGHLVDGRLRKISIPGNAAGLVFLPSPDLPGDRDLAAPQRILFIRSVMLNSIPRRYGLAAGLLLLIIFKFWLVHTEDIYG